MLLEDLFLRYGTASSPPLTLTRSFVNLAQHVYLRTFFATLSYEDPSATKDALCMSAENVVFGQSKVWKIDSLDLEAPKKPREVDPVKKDLALLSNVVDTSNALEMQSTVRWAKMNPEFTGPFLYKFGTQTDMMAPKLMAVATGPAELTQHVVSSMLKDVCGGHQVEYRVKLTKEEGHVYITFAHEHRTRTVHPFSNERVLVRTCPALVQKDKFRCPRGHLYGPEVSFVPHRLLCSICKSDTYAAQGHLCANYREPRNKSSDALGVKCEFGILCIECAAVPAMICLARPWPITVKPLSTEILMRAHMGMSYYYLDNVVDPEIFDRNRRRDERENIHSSQGEGPHFPPADNPLTFEWYSPAVVAGRTGAETRVWKQRPLSVWNIASHWTECPEWIREYHGSDIRRQKPPYTVFIGVSTLDHIDGIQGEQGRVMPMVTLLDPRREVSLLKLFALNRALDFRAVVDRMGVVHGLEVSGKRFEVQHFPFRFITLCQDIRRTEFEIEVESALNERQRGHRIGMSVLSRLAKYFESGADEHGDVRKCFRQKLEEINNLDLSHNWKNELEGKWEEFAKNNGLETPLEGWNNLTRKGYMWCTCRGFSRVSSNAPQGLQKDCEFRLVPLSSISNECICAVRVEPVSRSRADPNFWTEDTLGNEMRVNRKIIEVVRHPRYRVKNNFNVKLIEGDIVHLKRQECNRCLVIRMLHNEFFGRPFWIPSSIIGLPKLRSKTSERTDDDAQTTNYGYSSPSDAYFSSSDDDVPGTFRAYRTWAPPETERAVQYPNVLILRVLQKDHVRVVEGDVGDVRDIETRRNVWLRGEIVGDYGAIREGYFPSYVLWP